MISMVSVKSVKSATAKWCWALLTPLICSICLMTEVTGVAGRRYTFDDDLPRWTLALLIVLTYTVFCFFFYTRNRRGQLEKAQLWGEAKKNQASTASGHSQSDTVLIAFASQTGFAEKLAMHTLESLRDGGLTVRIAPLEQLEQRDLSSYRRILFIVSTTGEGDAPDSATEFARHMEHIDAQNALHTLTFGLLALGDKSYVDYCAFGRQLDRWLQQRGAQPLFDPIEVDNGDINALNAWRQQFEKIDGYTKTGHWNVDAYQRWRLAERRILNPDSVSESVFHLMFHPEDPAVFAWKAGDIAEVVPQNSREKVKRFLQTLSWDDLYLDDQKIRLSDALLDKELPNDPAAVSALHGLDPLQLIHRLQSIPRREYSIASIPGQGTLDLMVRRVSLPDGEFGIGSGWLTQHAPLDTGIALRIRTNTAFHPPSHERPLILIGAGTGLAGLRAHLHARAAAGKKQNWLIFGERSSLTDYLHRTEIENWLTHGVLQRLDLVFSRDHASRPYVQDKLRDSADDLKQWIDDGAAIYVCGRLKGMGAGVAAALQEILGKEQMIRLQEEGRYRRDVY